MPNTIKLNIEAAGNTFDVTKKREGIHMKSISLTWVKNKIKIITIQNRAEKSSGENTFAVRELQVHHSNVFS